MTTKPAEDDFGSLIQFGILQKDAGNYPKAIEVYKKVLEKAQKDPIKNASIIQQGKVNLSISLTDLGTFFKQQGKLSDGMNLYLEAINHNPHYAPAYYNIGVIYSEACKWEDALKFYLRAIQEDPHSVESHCNMGVIYKNMGKLEQAIGCYRTALQIDCNFAIASSNLAVALNDYGTKIKTMGKIRESLEEYKRALYYNPHYADAYYNLGVAYGELQQVEKSVVCYELAIHFNPRCCEAYNNFGVIFKDQENYLKAIQYYHKALEINPRFSQVLNNLGVVYTVQGMKEDALKCLNAALTIDPNYVEAYNNLGVLYRDNGDIPKSLSYYEKALVIQPDVRNAGQNRLLAMNYHAGLSHTEIFQAHQQWGKRFASLFTPYTNFDNSRETSRKIRIGYLSPDFFTHSVSYFIETILKNHDHSRFQIFCYSNVVKEDHTTIRLKKYADVWRNVTGLSTPDAARLIKEDRIDILVELAGHTAGNRLDVCAMKPAPVLVTYLGYPNTTGLPTIDYRITDPIVDPVSTAQQFTEKLYRLPECFISYTPVTESPEVSKTPGLENGFITFGSFNNLAKMTPEVFGLWAKILIAVPKSKLLLKCKPFATPSVQELIWKQFESLGIEPNRVELCGLIPQTRDHLRAYSLIDVSLDTFPYAGTTTTCESLWLGVPCITLSQPNLHAANVGVTLLKQIGLDEFVTTTKEQYLNVAVKMAENMEKLQSIRSGMRERLTNSILLGSAKFTLQIEDAFSKMWSTWCSSPLSSASAITSNVAPSPPLSLPSATPSSSSTTPSNITPRSGSTPPNIDPSSTSPLPPTRNGNGSRPAEGAANTDQMGAAGLKRAFPSDGSDLHSKVKLRPNPVPSPSSTLPSSSSSPPMNGNCAQSSSNPASQGLETAGPEVGSASSINSSASGTCSPPTTTAPESHPTETTSQFPPS